SQRDRAGVGNRVVVAATEGADDTAGVVAAGDRSAIENGIVVGRHEDAGQPRAEAVSDVDRTGIGDRVVVAQHEDAARGGDRVAYGDRPAGRVGDGVVGSCGNPGTVRPKGNGAAVDDGIVVGHRNADAEVAAADRTGIGDEVEVVRHDARPAAATAWDQDRAEIGDRVVVEDEDAGAVADCDGSGHRVGDGV